MTRRIALTVDVEPDWGTEGTRAFLEVAPRFLRFLEERRMHATFFVVSDLADASSDVVAGLGERNEVGSHGRSHRRLDRISRTEALRELSDSRVRLQDCGARVEGFRAPFFGRGPGFAEMVAGAGYRYDASFGSVTPGPSNGRLGALPCPMRLGPPPRIMILSRSSGRISFSSS